MTMTIITTWISIRHEDLAARGLNDRELFALFAVDGALRPRALIGILVQCNFNHFPLMTGRARALDLQHVALWLPCTSAQWYRSRRSPVI